MGVKKIKVPKKSTVAPEEVLTYAERWKDVLDKHPYWIIGAIVALVIILGSAWGFKTYREGREAGARADYARVLENMPESQTSDAQAWEKFVPLLETFIKEHPDTKPALNAKLDLAQAYFQMRRYDEALKWDQQILSETPPQHALKPLVRYQMALAYEATGKVDEAIAQWQMLENEGPSGLEREAGWHLSRLYTEKEDYSKAVEHYEKALKTASTYPSSSLLEDELAAVKLKAQPPPENPKQSPVPEKPDSKG